MECSKGKQSGRAKRVGKKLMEVGRSFNPLAWQWIFSDGMPGHCFTLYSGSFPSSWSSAELTGLLSDGRVHPGGMV